MYRPEKSLHFYVVNPPISLQVIVSPEYGLQFCFLSSHGLGHGLRGLVFDTGVVAFPVSF